MSLEQELRVAVLVRWLLVGIWLLAPASMISVVSCGLDCNAQCEPSSVVVS